MEAIARGSWACKMTHLHSWEGRTRSRSRSIKTYRSGRTRTGNVTSISISITCSCREQQTSTLRTIQKCGVVACLRANSAGLALETARVALDEGISLLEITMTTPNALQVIAELVLEYPSAVIGAGTVLTREDAKNAELAGAKFVMSPAVVNDILEIFKDTHILYIPGAMTPTEVLNAHAFGARIIKLYGPCWEKAIGPWFIKMCILCIAGAVYEIFAGKRPGRVLLTILYTVLLPCIELSMSFLVWNSVTLQLWSWRNLETVSTGTSRSLGAIYSNNVHQQIYPVTILGGEQYIQALKRPFHHIPMVASQGITLERINLYIRKGASAVVLSDAIFSKTAMATRDFGLIKQLAALAVSKGKEALQSAAQFPV